MARVERKLEKRCEAMRGDANTVYPVTSLPPPSSNADLLHMKLSAWLWNSLVSMRCSGDAARVLLSLKLSIWQPPRMFGIYAWRSWPRYSEQIEESRLSSPIFSANLV